MNKTVYLIDFENVHEAGMTGLSTLKPEDELHLFYSQNAHRISLDVLQGMKAAFSVHRVNPGKQSLDMQLVSYLGYLIGLHGTDAVYVIVSKDNDYANTLSFWKQEADATVLRRAAVREDTSEGKQQEKPVQERVVQQHRREDNRRSRQEQFRTNRPERVIPVAVQEVVKPVVEPEQPEVPAAVEAPAVVMETSPEPQEIHVAAEEVTAVPETPEEVQLPVEREEQEPVQAAKRSRTRRGGRRNRSRRQDTPAAEEVSGPEAAATPEEAVITAETAEEAPEAEASEQPVPEEKQEAPAVPENAPEAEKSVPVKQSAKSAKKTADRENALQALELAGEDIAWLRELLERYSTDKHAKQPVYREIIKKLGQKHGLEIYSNIKNFI